MRTKDRTIATARSAASHGPSQKLARSHIVKRVEADGLGAEHRPAEQLKVSVEFMLSVAGAKSVAIASTFNGWKPDQTPMKKNGDTWEARVELPRGRYEYRFVVDGQWASDPNAKESVANPFGGKNSVLSL